ncbi:hypothetical protein L1887_59189 [Cichorium endivia]|nr:hypothetical protein L1887_59189 [Cichorium endivia]
MAMESSLLKVSGQAFLKFWYQVLPSGALVVEGTHEVPALVLEWEEVLLDELASVLGAHVGLALLVDLVHGHGTLVLVGLGVEVVEDVLLERVGVLPAPEHWTVHELVDGRVVPAGHRVPRVEPGDGAKVKVVDGHAVAVGQHRPILPPEVLPLAELELEEDDEDEDESESDLDCECELEVDLEPEDL